MAEVAEMSEMVNYLSTIDSTLQLLYQSVLVITGRGGGGISSTGEDKSISLGSFVTEAIGKIRNSSPAAQASSGTNNSIKLAANTVNQMALDKFNQQAAIAHKKVAEIRTELNHSCNSTSRFSDGVLKISKGLSDAKKEALEMDLDRFQQEEQEAIQKAKDLEQAIEDAGSSGNMEGLSNGFSDAKDSMGDLKDSISLGGIQLGNLGGIAGKVAQSFLGMVGSLTGIEDFDDFVKAADEYVGNSIQLGYLLKDLESVDDLQEMIYQKAKQISVSYKEMTKDVARVGNAAKDIFQSNEEMVDFVSLINQAFGNTGLDSSVTEDLKKQLFDDMTKGTITESTIQNIRGYSKPAVDFLQLTPGQEMSTQDFVSAVSSPESVQAITDTYNSLPLTAEQSFERLKNSAQSAIEGILGIFGQIINSPIVQVIINIFVSVFNIIKVLIDMIAGAISWVIELLTDVFGDFDEFTSWFSELIACLIDAFFSIVEPVEGVRNIIIEIFKGILTVVENVINSILDIVNGMIGEFNIIFDLLHLPGLKIGKITGRVDLSSVKSFFDEITRLDADVFKEFLTGKFMDKSLPESNPAANPDDNPTIEPEREEPKPEPEPERPDYGGIGSNVANISDNTDTLVDSVDITREDLKYVRELSEREAISNLTSVHLDARSTNTIGSNVDFQKMEQKLANVIHSVVLMAAEKPHQ